MNLEFPFCVMQMGHRLALKKYHVMSSRACASATFYHHVMLCWVMLGSKLHVHVAFNCDWWQWRGISRNRFHPRTVPAGQGRSQFHKRTTYGASIHRLVSLVMITCHVMIFYACSNKLNVHVAFKCDWWWWRGLMLMKPTNSDMRCELLV